VSRDLTRLIHFQANEDGSEDGGTGDAAAQEAARVAAAQEAERQAQEAAADKDTVPKSEHSKVQREAQNLRQRLKALEDAALSDSEKIAKELDELKTTMSTKDAEVRSLRVEVLAARAGIVDPEAAAKLLDWEALGDDADNPKKLEAALKQLVKDKPYLAGTAPGGSDGGAGDGSGAEILDMNAAIRRAAGRG